MTHAPSGDLYAAFTDLFEHRNWQGRLDVVATANELGLQKQQLYKNFAEERLPPETLVRVLTLLRAKGMGERKFIATWERLVRFVPAKFTA